MHVEVLVRDVGDDGHVELAAGDALLRQSVRGGFQHAVSHARVHHLREVALHVVGIGRGGVQAGVQHALADHGVDGADQAGLDARRRENGVNEIARRRFAVGARDADHDQLARGEAVPRGVEPGEGFAAITHFEVGNITAERGGR